MPFLQRTVSKLHARLQRLIQEKGGLAEFLKYAAVGCGAVLVDFGLFEILLQLLGREREIIIFSVSLHPEQMANTAGMLAGFFFSYLINRVWTFRSSGNVPRQLALMALLLCVNILITNQAITFLGRKAGAPFALAKPLMQAVTALWNFVYYKYVVYPS